MGTTVTISIEEYDKLREFEKLAESKYAIYRHTNQFSEDDSMFVFPENDEMCNLLKERIKWLEKMNITLNDTLKEIISEQNSYKVKRSVERPKTTSSFKFW